MTTDSASKLKGLAWVFVACLMGAAVAFGLSPLARAIPWKWEKEFADGLGSTEQGCSSNPQARALLQRLVTRLYPISPDDASFSIDVRVVKNPVVNAYAGLGGHISIYSGLLKQARSPEEVAGVLAHEIEHVHHRHIIESVITHMLTSGGINMVFSGSAVDWSQFFLNMGFSRTQEAQADHAGLLRLQKAHVDNRGFRDFFERMEREGSMPAFISDHPSNNARMDMVETFDNKDVTPVMTAEEWGVLKSYCSER